jgi:preprotein translocase subunit SecB
MSDTSASGNARSNNREGSEAPAGPSVNVLGQYLKDLSFENPRAPMSLQPREQSPAININVNVGARQLGQSEIEVTLTMEAKAGTGADVLFAVEIAYAGVFRLLNVPAEHLQPFVMIECPRLLFPFARQIVADATRNGGFPPLMVDPIDFVALYQQNAARNQANPVTQTN